MKEGSRTPSLQHGCLLLRARPELVATAPPHTPVYRIGRGPSVFDPPPWEIARDDGTFGGRFDDPAAQPGVARSVVLPVEQRFRIIYCATDRAGAYGESIARFRDSISLLALTERVEDGSPKTSHLHGVIPSDWRLQRRLGRTQLEPSLRCVDLGAVATLTHLRNSLAGVASDLGLSDIDLGTVVGPQRRFTQEAARYIYELTDDDGMPEYAGIRYVSRLNSGWECWAIFHDRMLHTTFPNESIFPNDAGLFEAARVLGLVLPEAS